MFTLNSFNALASVPTPSFPGENINVIDSSSMGGIYDPLWAVDD